MKLPLKSLIALLAILSSCTPYAKGPVFTIANAQKTFRPLIDFMDIEQGMAVADVGAGSGALTVIMATQLEDCDVYIQDIDHEVLQQENVNKMVNYYSKKLGYDLRQKNQFHVVYGTTDQTNLPDQSIDVIYSNATIHVFDNPAGMLQDLQKKLKPDGRLFIRDSFKGHDGEGAYCTAKDCGKPLLTIDEFLTLMSENGYILTKQTPDFSGYPLFGFEVKN